MINVVLCGGNGTRLWPVSRENYPKQFLKILNNKSFLQKTIENNLKFVSKFILVSNEHQYFMAVDQLDELKIDNYSSIIEPIGRNTAASIALSAFSVEEDDILFVTPSDHLITNNKYYEDAILKAKEEAKKGSIVTFGITPLYPTNAYGYIKVKNSDFICDVEAFKEKPSVEIAKQYLEDGNYYWNSGMFMFKAGVYLTELKTYAPDIYEASKKAYENSKKKDYIRIQLEDMSKIRDESIDYAVMEYSNNIKMVKADIEWKDIGDFDALYDILDKDEDGNTKNDVLFSLNSKNNLIFGKYKKQIAINGVNDLIVVDTPTALLITKRGEAQNVKEIVKHLKIQNPDIVKFGRTVYKPWGKYTNLEDMPNFKVKKITVKPKARLSLQKHFHRSEHWIVVSGIAEVTKGDEVFLLRPNESTYIEIGEVHRLANPGQITLELIEVQVGKYLSEDDIIRLEDDYDR